MLRDTHHGKTCPYCLRTMSSRDARLHPTRDHVVPRVRGGVRTVICCSTCNGIKGDMMPGVWETFMSMNPGWWRLSCSELRQVKREDRAARGLPNGYRTTRRRQGTRPLPPTVVPPELIWS